MNIFEQAKDAGFTVTGGRIESPYIGGSDIGQRLKEFAALVRSEALEEAAQWFEGNEDDVGYAIATEIRGLK